MRYAKVAAQIVVAIATAIIAALAGDQVLTAAEWINVVLAAVGVAGVYVVPDLDGGAAKFAKGIVAALTAAGMLAVNLLASGITVSEWLQLIVAALAAIGIAAAPGPKHPATLARRHLGTTHP